MELRAIPSVDRALRELSDVGLPRPLILRIVRRELDGLRARLASASAGAGDADPMARIRAAVETLRLARLQPVINGTGVVIHTNFGRSPLPGAAIDAINATAGVYTNLEFDLASGQRGGRAEYVHEALAAACEAESAAVVNNCAAALVLILRHFVTQEKPEVVLSRGEMVQIGGGFRVPEILESAGATLREIGTTNRTTLADYEKALGDRTAMILKVHRSNFYMAGFVDSPPTSAIAELARQRGVLFVEDLGSGALAATEAIAQALGHEPTPAEVLAAGADLVTFSGDKLLGGPQAGVIAGRAEQVKALRADPLFRALRCDKLVLSALQATLDLHLSGQAEQVPILAMMAADVDSLRRRAQALAERLGAACPCLAVTISDATSQVGGGSLPKSTMLSITLDLSPPDGKAEALAARLRAGDPPVVGYISGGKLRLDLRTILQEQEEALIAAIRQAADSSGGARTPGGEE